MPLLTAEEQSALVIKGRAAAGMNFSAVAISRRRRGIKSRSQTIKLGRIEKQLDDIH